MQLTIIYFASAYAAQCWISLCYTHTLSDYVLAAAANLRGVLLCIKGRVTPHLFPLFTRPHFPASRWSTWDSRRHFFL